MHRVDAKFPTPVLEAGRVQPRPTEHRLRGTGLRAPRRWPPCNRRCVRAARFARPWRRRRAPPWTICPPPSRSGASASAETARTGGRLPIGVVPHKTAASTPISERTSSTTASKTSSRHAPGEECGYAPKRGLLTLDLREMRISSGAIRGHWRTLRNNSNNGLRPARVARLRERPSRRSEAGFGARSRMGAVGTPGLLRVSQAAPARLRAALSRSRPAGQAPVWAGRLRRRGPEPAGPNSTRVPNGYRTSRKPARREPRTHAARRAGRL